MIKIIRNSVKFIVNTNIWIALASVCFYELSLIQLGFMFRIDSTMLFLFFSSLFIYNFFILLGNKKKYHQWYKQYNFLLKILILLALIAMLSIVYFLSYKALFLLSLSALLTFFYATPFIKIGKNSFNFRKYWFLKSIIVALVWTLSTSLIPLYENNAELSYVLVHASEKFLFILGLTIPYDIKDLKEDTEQEGMETMAMKFGLKFTKKLSIAVLAIGLFLALYLYTENHLAILISYIIAIVISANLDINKPTYWFTFLIDSCIIIYCLCVVVQSMA